MAKTFKELRVWHHAMDLAMEVFEMTRAFPAEGRFALTDQIRRSSRSVASNIAEAWRKPRYIAAFRSKLNDSEGEGAESQTSVEGARRCGYITAEQAARLDDGYERSLAQLSRMIDDAERWCTPSPRPIPHAPPSSPKGS